jgi:hypothetical protein
MRWSFVIAQLVCLAATALLVSCSGAPEGPSLSNIALRNVSLAPTAGNPALCCCRVVATAENRNSVPVHLTIKFSALDGTRSDPIATILHFVPDLEPGAQRQIDAAGFVFPCSVIKSVKTEVDVSGIAFPPL